MYHAWVLLLLSQMSEFSHDREIDSLHTNASNDSQSTVSNRTTAIGKSYEC